MFALPTRRLRRRNRRALRQAGMTLLEIMIVLAILALVMGFLVGPRIYRAFQDSKEDSQRVIVKQYVNEVFLSWSRRNMTKGCPSQLTEVAQEIDRPDTKDLWGRELLWFCGDNLPPGAKGGFAVMSLGPDGQQGTKDDIKSWE